ncbi:MAG: hypothetical protein ACKVIQ_01830, partial [Acidimicrobiales bacterium]
MPRLRTCRITSCLPSNYLVLLSIKSDGYDKAHDRFLQGGG